MCNKLRLRKLLALVLCLAILAGMALLPALAAPDEETGDAPVAAPAEAVEAPADKEDAPDEKEEVPADNEETPADKEEAPAEKEDAPADKEETPDEKEDAPAGKEDAPADKEDAPDEKEEVPADNEETPAAKEEIPDDKEDALAPTQAPLRQPRVPVRREEPTDETPEVQEPEDEAPTEEPVAALFGLERSSSDNDFVIDWSQEELQDSGWDSKHGVVRTDHGYYLYFECGQYSAAALEVYTPDNPYRAALTFTSTSGDPDRLSDNMNNSAIWENAEVRHYISGGQRYTEAYIPMDLLPDKELTFLCNNASFFFATPAAGEDAQPTPEPVYNGIVIDGDYADWAAVPKTPADNGGDAFHADMEVATVWDGEYVYLYLHYLDGNPNAVGAYGPRGDGQFAITTDLGRTMLIQPQFNGQATIGGVDDAQVALDNWDRTSTEKGHELEIAIPVSALPEYLESISFGYYMVEPMITGIVDMTGSSQGVGPFGGNVVIDGKYNDWVGYPHTLIEYDNPGIQHHKVDGEGALWSDDGVLYGHVVTEHPDHLEEQGSEYLAAISIAFNGDHDPKALPKDGNFYPRILAISEDGTVIDYYKTLNEGHSLPEGTHTFYIFDTRTDPIYQFSTFDENNTLIATPTAAELKANAFGTMKITVTGTKDDMEFDLDLQKVADYIGQNADDFKVIEAQFGRIGQQWITTAGTPTGPVLGVALLIGAVGAPMCYSAAKKRRQAKSAAGAAEK